MSRGKDICKQLKAIRKSIAMNYNLDYNPRECTHEGDCPGTCPLCDAEVLDLQRQLDERGITDVNLNVAITPRQIRLPQEEGELAGNFVLMGDPMPPMKQRKRTLYAECQVAGAMFHDLEEVWDDLEEGVELALVRHKHNPHDKNAVAVCLAEDFDGDVKNFDFDNILGYVPKERNEMIANLLDLGWDEMFQCELSEKKGTVPHGKLKMRIYLMSKDEVDVSEILTRVVELDDEGYKRFTFDLDELGYCYFRWDTSSLMSKQEQIKKNDKIVFLYKGKKSATLYLMHCIVQGDEKSADFIREEDKALLLKEDYCCFYVFSIVRGPIKVELKELDFLGSEDITYSSPSSYLSLEASERIMDIINE